MGGLRLAVVVMVVVAAWARGTMFKVADDVGACGSGFFDTHALGDIVCAMICNQSEFKGRLKGRTEGR